MKVYVPVYVTPTLGGNFVIDINAFDLHTYTLVPDYADTVLGVVEDAVRACITDKTGCVEVMRMVHKVYTCGPQRPALELTHYLVELETDSPGWRILTKRTESKG